MTQPLLRLDHVPMDAQHYSSPSSRLYPNERKSTSEIDRRATDDLRAIRPLSTSTFVRFSLDPFHACARLGRFRYVVVVRRADSKPDGTP